MRSVLLGAILATLSLSPVFGAADRPTGDLYVVQTPENPWHKTPAIKVTADDVLGRLAPAHPRLILTKAALESLRTRYAADPVFAGYVAAVLAEARRFSTAPAVKTHREALARLPALGFAYHWTGDATFAQPAIRDLLTVCKLPDWDWKHFLTTAESAMTVGLGYDWFYDAMDAETRKTIREGLITHGLIPGIAAYAGAPYGWFRHVRHNWNQVCNSGLMVGALAIAESDPAYARLIVPQAISSIALALNEYAPDGAYPEGPGYSGFGTTATLYGLAALQSSLGTDFGLSAFEGFSGNYHYRLHVRGPSGLSVAYADCAPKAPRYADWGFFWMGQRFDDEALIRSEQEFLRESKRVPTAMHVLFYRALSATPPAPLPRDRHFRGPVEFVAMRSSWSGRDGLYVGLKAGYNQVNHGHLDLGNFELDASGERWFYDIGGDDYSLADYFDMSATRWTYYRNNSTSHNVPLIDGQSQDIHGTSRVRATSLNGAEPFGIVDLSPAYASRASRVERGVKLLQDRTSVLVQDEFELTGTHTVTWAVMTNARIVLRGNEAELEQNGKKLLVTVLTPGAVFEQVDTRQAPPQKTNEGIQRLACKVTTATGRTTIAVLIRPANVTVVAPTIRPLADW
jgi:hypothetical protein